eukprot:TRINITY_DN21590_c0_g1_i1.p1 TRINITY_DN21590_c0_g1~~TRINITY_DN21590_c0_g1_i1.p1  ORF type:complete len:465 (+),score=162.84 TRINITY_DN21590_c0_g1_i1:675-2069(+)
MRPSLVLLAVVLLWANYMMSTYVAGRGQSNMQDILKKQQHDIEQLLRDNKEIKSQLQEALGTVHGHPLPTPKPTRKAIAVYDDSSDADDDTTPAPTPAPKKKKKATKKKKSGSIGIDDLDLRDTLEGDKQGTIAVVMFVYRRDATFRKAMSRVLDVIDGDKAFRVFASQDGTEFPLVTEAIESYGDKVVHLTHERNDSGATAKEKRLHFEPYYAISHHYGWALNEIMSVAAYDRVIVLEEDIEVAGDFFSYMKAASPLLDKDDTLFCVSAWNDNGKAELVQSSTALYRTDFFPGLGWMFARSFWEEFGPIWPQGFWDDWLRQPKHRKGRACIRPEVPRSFMWCDEGGVSKGQFCRQYLSHMKLENKAIDWDSVQLSMYEKDNYDEWLDNIVDKATTIRGAEEVEGDPEYKIYYTTNREYKALAESFGLMTDFKDSVPRTAYKGIVTFRWKGVRVHLVARLSLYE